ncbi:MAG: diaminopimelate epimerase [Oscillospiraceae bacterium]|nr:diaminopimelate epimerase [Oscillospiraceae bacterium]
MKFTKMHGTGNDFIIIDDRLEKFKGEESELAIRLCHRRFSIGADGVIFVREKDGMPYMKIVNSDGSNANMCGNGIRCFAAFLFKNSIINNSSIKIYTDDGVKNAIIEGNDVTIDMGKFSFSPEDIPALSDHEIVREKICVLDKSYEISSLLLGVPHTVIFYDDENEINVQEGAFIEKYKLFPKGTNINFCKVVNKDELIVKTWERGAGATFSCGTGASASVVCGDRLGLLNKEVLVDVPGGKLKIKIEGESVFMKGEATFVFEGEINYPFEVTGKKLYSIEEVCGENWEDGLDEIEDEWE